MVLVGEVGGRLSEETVTFLRLLAASRARSESALLRRRAEQAWRMRWGGMLACDAARAFAASLLEQRSNVGGDADPPLIYDVLSKLRHARSGKQWSFDFVFFSRQKKGTEGFTDRHRRQFFLKKSSPCGPYFPSTFHSMDAVRKRSLSIGSK